LVRLVDVITASERHYTLCIKPNDEKSSKIFTSSKVLQQLKCNGVFETVKLRKEGYSLRLPFKNFEDRFWVCLDEDQKGRDGITKFMEQTLPGECFVSWAMGKEKVFMKETALDKLQLKKKEIWDKKFVKAQSFIRSYYQRKKYLDQRNASISTEPTKREIVT